MLSVQSRCEACRRKQTRIDRGHSPRQPPISVEEKRRRKREAYRIKMQDPEYAARRRERQREYARELQASRRRELGIPVRGKRVVTDSGFKDSYEVLDARPLLEWLPMNYRSRLDESLLRGIRRVAATGSIELGLVDRILVALGAPGALNELYPLEEPLGPEAAELNGPRPGSEV